MVNIRCAPAVVSKFATISSVEDIQAIARANTLPNLTQKAYIIIGTEETAQGVVDFLKKISTPVPEIDK